MYKSAIVWLLVANRKQVPREVALLVLKNLHVLPEQPTLYSRVKRKAVEHWGFYQRACGYTRLIVYFVIVLMYYASSGRYSFESVSLI